MSVRKHPPRLYTFLQEESTRNISEKGSPQTSLEFFSLLQGNI